MLNLVRSVNGHRLEVQGFGGKDGGRLVDQLAGEILPAAGARPAGGRAQIVRDLERFSHDEISAGGRGGCA